MNGAGIVAFGLALIAVTLFVAAASLIRADRSTRVPVVTWGWPAAVWAILGGIASAGGWVLSVVGLAKSRRLLGPASLGFILCIWGALGFLFYLASLYEN
jgi:hypothetical protein